MPTITQDSPSPPRNRTGYEPLALRLHGGGLDGRVVRLASPKCTVGSGPRCTLRLLGPGIRPLHCLIVRGARATFVRRWAPDTRLNGRSFEDAVLRAGDRLTIGPLDLEVLEVLEADGESSAGAAPIALRAGPRPAAIVDPEPQNADQPGAGDGISRALPQPAPEIQEQIAGLRSRARNLADALRESRQRQEELEARVQASLQAQRDAEAAVDQIASQARGAGELRERLSRLAEEVQLHKDREQALLEQLEQSRTREEKLQQDVEQMASQSTRHEQIEARLAELERERDEIERLRRELEADRERLAAERAACQAQRQELEELESRAREAAASPPSSPDSSRDAEAEAALAHLRELSLLNDPPAEERAERDDDASPRRTGAPVSFIEKYAPHLLDDADGDEPEAPETATADPWQRQADDDSSPRTDNGVPPEEAAGSQRSRPGAPASPEDEESLEDYMAKLMQRVRGDETPWTPRETEPTKPAPPPSATAAEPASTPAAGREDHPSAAFRWEDVKRTAAPPERDSNFAAMRELANESAHNAISTYRTQRTVRDAANNWLAGGICLASGVATLWLAPEWESAAAVGGGAGLLAGGYFWFRGTLNAVRLIRGAEPQPERAGAEEPGEVPRDPGAPPSTPPSTSTGEISGPVRDESDSASELQLQAVADEVRRLGRS